MLIHGDTPPTTPTLQRQAAWASYWGSGSAHSCVGSYGSRYGGAIGRYWIDLFSQLQPGAKVLDLATGNGALVRLLIDARPQADFRCDAVDIATVQPSWTTTLPQAQRNCMRFHAGTSIDAMPFDDHSFDLVVSQYGFEYAPIDPSIRELARVLKPRGRLALAVHHADSQVAKLARLERDQLRWLLQESELFDCGKAMAEPMARTSTPQGRASLDQDRAAEALRLHFNSVLTRMASRATQAHGADGLFVARDAVMSALSQAATVGQHICVSTIERLRTEHMHALVRLEDMLEHAVDRQGANHLRALLQAHLHRDVVLSEMLEGDYLMAWTLQLQPAAT